MTSVEGCGSRHTGVPPPVPPERLLGGGQCSPPVCPSPLPRPPASAPGSRSTLKAAHKSGASPPMVELEAMSVRPGGREPLPQRKVMVPDAGGAEIRVSKPRHTVSLFTQGSSLPRGKKNLPRFRKDPPKSRKSWNGTTVVPKAVPKLQQQKVL